ncbi:MAG TPA: hypothetical protein VFJ30_18145 [Phycisphaerae bacterium]|nr:hypothetical protein [Phycisphaerae bacterium]
MKTSICLAVILIAAGSVFAGALCQKPPLETIAERLKVPAVSVAELTAAPSLDGAADLKGWTGPLPFTHLSGRSDTAPPVKTAGYLARHGRTLYVAVRCFEPDMKAITAKPVARDGNVWAGDSVEVMLQGGLEPSGTYYHFAVNPAAGLYDAKVNQAAWNSTAGVRILKDAASWTAVLAVPIDEIAGTSADPLWRVNLHRARPKRGGAPAMDVAWSPTFNRSNHIPERFAAALVGEVKDLPSPADLDGRLTKMLATRIVYRQTFQADRAGIDSGKIVTGEGPGGQGRYLRLEGQRGVVLEKPLSRLTGLQMALAYRCNPDQHGVVVHGMGTVVAACRPGRVNVLGRGLKVARETCLDADRQTRAFDLGLDAFQFVRPYGHCQQGNMPPTPDREWAVAGFAVDDMYSNDTHSKAIAPDQQYKGFRIYLNGPLPPKHFLELGWIVIWRGRDGTPPTAPAKLTAARADGKTTFRWTPATDDTMVRNYELLRRAGEGWDSVTISTMADLTAPSTDFPAGTYAIRAVDVAGNVSEPSAPVVLGGTGL